MGNCFAFVFVFDMLEVSCDCDTARCTFADKRYHL